MRQLTILVAILTMAGCSNEEDPEPVDIAAADFHGEWAITSFKLAGEDQTATLSGFTLEIFSNGDFLINKDGANDSYGSYEVDETTKVLTVELRNPKTPSDAIDGTWQVYAKSDQSLTLKSFAQGEKKDFVLTRL